MKNNKFNLLMSNYYKLIMEFGYLQSLNLERRYDYISEFSKFYLTIILSDHPEDIRNNHILMNSQKLILTFEDVSKLEFGNALISSYKLFVDIIDLTQTQMEAVSYKVVEEENSLFSFYCKKFEFKVADA